MPENLLIVEGVNLTSYIPVDAYSVDRTDIEGGNGGRTMDGIYHRDYITSKISVSLTLTDAPMELVSMLEHDVLRGKPYVSVTCNDHGRERTIMAMVKNNSFTVSRIYPPRSVIALVFEEV